MHARLHAPNRLKIYRPSTLRAISFVIRRAYTRAAFVMNEVQK
jgi:hypothetical protein